jgi:hypothetical protein
VVHKKPLFGLSKSDKYQVADVNPAYGVAQASLVGEKFTLSEIQKFNESVYTDDTLAEIAAGDLDRITMPRSTLAQILLEQLRETCYLDVGRVKRADGPALEVGGNRFPDGKAPRKELEWQDEGNLFLTNVRLVLPSDTFTFVRLDRRVVGLKVYEDGLAIQERGNDKAMYFVGCRAHEAALVGAYIMGKIAKLRA